MNTSLAFLISVISLILFLSSLLLVSDHSPNQSTSSFPTDNNQEIQENEGSPLNIDSPEQVVNNTQSYSFTRQL